jgi:glutamate-ammonia-ligase adenylyltransferase
MFRIDMRHILGQTGSFDVFARELTDLAEVVLATAIERVRRELADVHGTPKDDDGGPARFALAALGKCGGRELGFASDIELMFLYDGSGETSGPRGIPTPEYFEKLVVEVTRAIQARREGIFQIDLQLRPYGASGSLAVSLDAFRRYFAPGGPAWPYERQALVKLRPIAGDAPLGEELTRLRDRYVYSGAAFDVTAMRGMRERQMRHLVEAGRINAKFSKGGMVDLEYMVQGLQMAHGHRHASLRVTNTAAAIDALAEQGLVSAENAARLREALTFLQQLINALRMVRGNSKDLTVPPEQSEEFAFLARRLGYGHDASRLSVTLNETMGWVQRLEGRLLG